jgi:hypothetical protein
VGLPLDSKSGKLMVAGLPVLVVAGTLIGTLIVPKNTFNFQELIVTFYTNGTVNFSADVTGLVRSLGIISLLTLFFGLTMGAALGLMTIDFRLRATGTEGDLKEYEKALALSGFVKITTASDGTTFQLTEVGKRFLRDYAFLNRGIENSEARQRPNAT